MTQYSQVFDKYDISEWGFLSNPIDNVQNLPKGFEEYKNIINLIQCQDGILFRNEVNSLEKGLSQDFYVEKTNNLTNVELKRIYLVFTFYFHRTKIYKMFR